MWIATKIVVHVNRNPCDRNIFIFIKLIYFKPKKSTFSTNFSVNFEGTSINIGVFESILVLQHPNRGESRKRLNATGVRYVSIRMNRKPGSKKKRGGGRAGARLNNTNRNVDWRLSHTKIHNTQKTILWREIWKNYICSICILFVTYIYAA